ncbi:MAG: arylsulfatase [Dyadobacter sp.]|nr:arylsulfatase [Dyadobacter sp.]
MTLPALCLAQKKRPNIVVILADDLGFSDVGCYGSEIPTPNIDFLAKSGVRFTHFYNNTRCCPSRASLLTGLYPHDAGIGRMAEDPEDSTINNEGVDGYRGYLTKNAVTIAEVLKTAGYHTYMSGKWHVGMHGKEKWPLQRGFERYYGILSGGSSYLKPFPPRGITVDNGEPGYDVPEDYYTTDAFADNAVRFIREQKDSKPFFLYLAFNAPHWPLHAKQADIQMFQDKYLVGWDSVRHERWRKQLKLGLVKPEWGVSERDMRPWSGLTEQEKKDVAYRMSVYAAQVYALDYNIGKVIETLKERKEFDNTLIMFLSDNGAAAEPYQELGGKPMEEVNNPAKFWAVSYGAGWATVSNTPYKKWKNTTYEGGTATPMIVSWPAGGVGNRGGLVRLPYHIIDIMPTAIEAANARYPATFNNHTIIKSTGISLIPAITGGTGKTHDYFYWEHEENCAVIHGPWKAVKKLPGDKWELYNLEKDRTESSNLAASHPDILKDLAAHWNKWASDHQVFPKGKTYFKRFPEK